MKARIKGTNIIVECKGIGTLINENKGIECKHIDGSIEVIPADCLIELGESFDLKEPFDWQSFRAEAAKDILCATLSGGIASGAAGILEKKELIVERSIEIADELIKQLKEKEVRNDCH